MSKNVAGNYQKYVLIEWPSSQQIMEEDWFNTEAILYNADTGQVEKFAAYFIPYNRYVEAYQKGLFQDVMVMVK